MASGFYQLPAYNAGAGIDFSPVERALDGWHQTNYQNALLGLRERAEGRADEEQGWQREKQQQATADRKSKALGAAAQSLLNMPPEQRGRAMQAWRMADKDFDGDLKAAGFNPDDVDTWGPVLVAKTRGVVDPLDQRKTEADINRTNAQADYYRQGGRTAGGSSSADERIAERYMSENPDLTYMEALELARTRPADRTRREGLAARNARDGLAPEEVEPWRDRYGVSPNSPNPAARRQPQQPQQGQSNRFDFSGPMRQQQHQQILNEAREAIKRGADPAKVQQRLQGYGIDTSGF